MHETSSLLDEETRSSCNTKEREICKSYTQICHPRSDCGGLKMLPPDQSAPTKVQVQAGKSHEKHAQTLRHH